METIHILHTNDIHSHLENWPRIARFLHEKQMSYSEAFTFDIGDAIDRLHPLTDASMGWANIELMNNCHYDGVTIGNNEGLVLSHEALNHLYDKANFDVLLANLKELPNDSQPKWAQKYKILTTDLGTKIGVLGLTVPYELTYPPLGWRPHDVDDTLDYFLPILRDKTDVVILLSHLGLPTDERLARKYDIDVILGAHTHHLLPHGKMINQTILAGAGRYGENIGDVTLTLEGHHLVNQTAVTTPVYELPESVDDFNLIKGWLNAGRHELESQHVAVLPRTIGTDEQAYDALRALKSFYQVPAALVSTGMFVEDLPKGELSRYELLESMPHAINPMLITLTGAQIKNLMISIEKQTAELTNFPMKGSGFRGKVFGYMRFDGIDRQQDGQILYHGENLIMDRTYQIATLDHYKWIPFFPIIADAPSEITLNIILRELMADYYTDKYKG
ncbi:MAG: bifunctional metallophosphatase/5'-nucleotidase [Leuconostoc falkenbergense]|uniref:bifunctional metallophosphatase/5'-nucleotidase n=1 Tax=Leuconostoc falkenbergense TaxID=2766470 RepID=UPI003F98FDB8